MGSRRIARALGDLGVAAPRFKGILRECTRTQKSAATLISFLITAVTLVASPRALADDPVAAEEDIAALAEELGLNELKCPASGPALRTEFIYSHDILEVTTGQNAMSTVHDQLIVIGHDRHTVCFGLHTFGRNYHMCNLAGVARAVSKDVFVFRESETVIEFEFIDPAHVRVTPSGDGYKEHCGSFGWAVIEPGVYGLREAASHSSNAP
jgi:nucleotide-binding universal stress UspA family protein